MPQTKAGAALAAARRYGVEPAEYLRRVAAGEKFCQGCRVWHPVAAFSADRSRGDGLNTRCREWQGRTARERYTPRDRVQGRRYVAARDGDAEQARGRVNHLVRIGVLRDPDRVPCAGCGHAGDDRRHNYHHHRGYAAAHHEDVVALCTVCHAAADGVPQKARTRRRRADGTFEKGGS